MRTTAKAAALALAAAWPTPGLAGDGVREISQACATGPGCLVGDAPGFPVEITFPTSVRLVGNLSVPDANTTAIEVLADEVTIDLNGFSIRGVTECAGSPLSCMPLGSGRGIDADGFEAIAVRNGTVSGLGAMGVWVGGGSRIEDVHLAENGDEGLWASSASVIVGASTVNHPQNGLIAFSPVVTRSAATGNTITATAGVVASCVSGGTSRGVIASGIVLDVAARDNAGAGIVGPAAAAGVILPATAVVAESAATSNGGVGVQLDSTAVLVDGSARGNAGAGADGGFAYRGTVFSANGAPVGSTLQTGTNVCNGSTTCP